MGPFDRAPSEGTARETRSAIAVPRSRAAASVRPDTLSECMDLRLAEGDPLRRARLGPRPRRAGVGRPREPRKGGEGDDGTTSHASPGGPFSDVTPSCVDAGGVPSDAQGSRMPDAACEGGR